MSENSNIVCDSWNSYVANRDGVTMYISFDEAVARGERDADLLHCARVIIPLRSPNAAGAPISPEAELLWDMEDEVVALLAEHQVRCRLVGRLTYDGLREIVFQLNDWEAFRPPVGLLMMRHEDYEIDVSEHEGWDFFDNYIQPRLADQIYMADRSVVDSLINSGSDPAKEHALEYVFRGDPAGLTTIAATLQQRGYQPYGELDVNSGQVVLVKRLDLYLPNIVQESLANCELAEQAGAEFDGWGAAVVK